MSDTIVDMAKVTQLLDAGWSVRLYRGGLGSYVAVASHENPAVMERAEAECAEAAQNWMECPDEGDMATYEAQRAAGVRWRELNANARPVLLAALRAEIAGRESDRLWDELYVMPSPSMVAGPELDLLLSARRRKIAEAEAADATREAARSATDAALREMEGTR